MSDCLFCSLIEKKENMLFEDDKVFAMLSPSPSVPGHILVMPKLHAPILEAVPDFVVSDMFVIANKLSIVLFEGLGCKGVNLLIQNGLIAGQTHNHVMLSVLPRFDNDNLNLSWEPKPASGEDLAKASEKLKDELKYLGTFEREKEKPIEVEKPKEVKESSDYRIKHLRRTP